MARFTFWLLAIVATVWVLWTYRRRLRIALRVLSILYPIMLLVSLIQGGLDFERIIIILAMLAVGGAVFAANRYLDDRGVDRKRGVNRK